MLVGVILKINKVFLLQATGGRERNGANGSVPQGQGHPPHHAEVEEDTFISGVCSSRHRARLDITMMDHPETSTRRMTDDDQDVRVRGCLGNNGSVHTSQTGVFQPSCSKLDIIRMDCPGIVADDDQDDLLRVVRGLLDKENQQNKDDQIRREWRMLAEAVDRWLFWSFLLITTVSTLLFLVILPFLHRGKFF